VGIGQPDDRLQAKEENMIAYHGKAEIKELYLARVRAHAAADELVKGVYWEKGKGCAVGCTVHSDSHRDYETMLGIPIELARLEDVHFERLENGDSKKWPELFLSSIRVGADLSMVWPKYAFWMLDGLPKQKDERVIKSIDSVRDLYAEWIDTGTKPNEDRWRIAVDAAGAAAAAAYAAAYAAAVQAASAAQAAARKNFWKSSSSKLIELLQAA